MIQIDWKPDSRKLRQFAVIFLFGFGLAGLLFAWTNEGPRLYDGSYGSDSLELPLELPQPEPADLVVCTDVLEHVEPECLENVLDDLKRVTKQALFLAVSTRAANKSTSDGQNTHKIVEDLEFWRPKIRKRFDIVQVVVAPGDKFTAILQAKGVGE